MHHIYTKKRFLQMSLPVFVLYTGFVIIPLMIALWLSFTTYKGIGTAVWNNFRNYKLLLSDKVLWRALGNNVKIAITSLVIGIPASFLLGYALKENSRRNTIYKTIIFSSNIIPGTIAGIIWTFILDPYNGLVNGVLRAIGLDSLCQMWIGGQTLTPYMVGLIGTWGAVGYYMIIWQVGMKNLPGEVLEASLLDGCNKVKQIWYVVVPMLKDYLVLIVISTVSGSINAYDTVMMLTGGGPYHASETLVTYMYTTVFTDKQYGYGMSIAVVEFAIAVVISMFSLWLSRRNRVDL